MYKATGSSHFLGQRIKAYIGDIRNPIGVIPGRSRTLNTQINIWALVAMSFYFWAFFTFFNTFTRRKVPSDQSLVISENCVHSLHTQTSWSCWIEGVMFERWSNVSVRPGPNPRPPGPPGPDGSEIRALLIRTWNFWQKNQKNAEKARKQEMVHAAKFEIWNKSRSHF